MNPELHSRNRWWLSLMLTVPFFVLGGLLVLHSAKLSGELVPFYLNAHFIAGMLLVLAPLLTLIALSLIVYKARIFTDRLKKNGLTGVARFISIYERTRMTADGPLIRIELEITTEIQNPYRIVYTENPRHIKPTFLYPGNRFRVLVDPNEKENILIDWTPLHLINPGQEYSEILDMRETTPPSPHSAGVSEYTHSFSM